jgi:hypothetical protein
VINAGKVVEDINLKMFFHEELSQKFPGSSPDLVIRFFNLPYPWGRTMDLVSTHPLRNEYQESSGWWGGEGKGQPALKVD